MYWDQGGKFPGSPPECISNHNVNLLTLPTYVVIQVYRVAAYWLLLRYLRFHEKKLSSQGSLFPPPNPKSCMMKQSLFCIDFPPGGRDLTHMSSGQGDEAISRQCMLDDLDPQATRSLFVGNIPKHINVYDLRDTFLRYGNVLVRAHLLLLLFPLFCYYMCSSKLLSCYNNS